MELRQLRYFCRACELGSYTAAAQELFVTEQTVSYAIKKLEVELGHALLIRGRYGVTPTQAGQEVLDKASVILSLSDELVTNMSCTPLEPVEVRFFVTTMGIPDSEGFSIDALDKFSADNPNIHVSISEAPTQKCLRAVRGGHADIALLYSLPDLPDIEPHLLINGEVAIAFSENHPLAKRDRISVADLKDEPILWATDTGDGVQTFNNLCRQYGFEPTIRTVPSSSYLDSAAAGKGFALALASHPKLTTKVGLTARRLVPQDDFTVPICLVVPSDCPEDSPSRLLLNYLLESWTPDARN